MNSGLDLQNFWFSEGTTYSCQTLAAIGAIANHPVGYKLLDKICKKTTNGFEIYFQKYPKLPIEVMRDELIEWTDSQQKEIETDFNQRLEQVKQILPPEKFYWLLPQIRPPYASGSLLARVLELAYAKLMVTLEPTAYPEINNDNAQPNFLRVFHSKSFHGNAARALNDMTNWPVNEIFASNTEPLDPSKSFAHESKEQPALKDKVYAQLKTISQEPNKYAAIVSSIGMPGNSFLYLDPGCIIVPYHDSFVKNIDDKNQTICIGDPYNSRIGLVLDYADFLQYYCIIATAIID